MIHIFLVPQASAIIAVITFLEVFDVATKTLQHNAKTTLTQYIQTDIIWWESPASKTQKIAVKYQTFMVTVQSATLTTHY